MEIQGQDFGIEIEMTGLTRSRAAEVIAEYFGTTKEYEGSFYDTYFARDTTGRKWKVMSDGSLDCQRKEGRRKVSADRNYSVEVVSPICQYGDIETVQELIRRLREAGAFVIPPAASIFTSTPHPLTHLTSVIWSTSWQPRRI